ncbi:MAG: hypothetical protein QOD71_1145 [Thermoleophilaceae bacterium]|jgi:hypothetical protein|nr:hypothetical protein [Thermoleophilaceae bacterium]
MTRHAVALGPKTALGCWPLIADHDCSTRSKTASAAWNFTSGEGIPTSEIV